MKVLDHGHVELISHMGGDLDVVQSARQSFNSAWRAGVDEGSDHRLIHYLMRKRHSTPFESVEFKFAVKAPIFIFRQWHRHRTWSYNEISGRYIELPEEFYVPNPANYGSQSVSNKQGRIIASDGYTVDEWSKFLRWEREQREAMAAAFKVYRRHISEGMPRETARIILPLATYSAMSAKVDLWNLLHFLELRLHAHAQWEMQQFAQAALSLIQPIVPISLMAWNKSNDPNI